MHFWWVIIFLLSVTFLYSLFYGFWFWFSSAKLGMKTFFLESVDLPFGKVGLYLLCIFHSIEFLHLCFLLPFHFFFSIGSNFETLHLWSQDLLLCISLLILFYYCLYSDAFWRAKTYFLASSSFFSFFQAFKFIQHAHSSCLLLTGR